jgi:PKD domain
LVLIVFIIALSIMWAAPSGAAAALYNLLGAPRASFAWSPQFPQVGEPVTLSSTSSVVGSRITSYAWDLADNGPFGAFLTGGPVASVSYATPGPHVVRLRVGAANGLKGVDAETITMTPLPASAGVLYPFPVVSISGTYFAFRVRIKRLAVKAPAGSRITITCGHARCPAGAVRRPAGSRRGHETWVRFRPFERFLPSGAILEVRVSKPGKIGAYTRFHVRRQKRPVRSDSCLDPAGLKPMACPSPI